MPSKNIVDFAYQVRDYMRGAEVVEGKNLAYSQENNAVIATIENGKSYKVRWTGSATVTLKKNSASGTEVTSGSTSPLSFTADSDFDLYFGSSADVTEIMVYDGNDTSDTYEPYYVPVKDRVNELEDIKTYTIKNGNTDVSGVSVRKLGRWVFMDLTNVNVGTFLGATIPDEIKPLVGCHFFGIVRDTSTSGVQWQGLLDLTTETQVQHIYYTDTYNTLRKKADTTSTNLIISSTAVYLSAI